MLIGERCVNIFDLSSMILNDFFCRSQFIQELLLATTDEISQIVIDPSVTNVMQVTETVKVDQISEHGAGGGVFVDDDVPMNVVQGTGAMKKPFMRKKELPADDGKKQKSKVASVKK